MSSAEMHRASLERTAAYLAAFNAQARELIPAQEGRTVPADGAGGAAADAQGPAQAAEHRSLPPETPLEGEASGAQLPQASATASVVPTGSLPVPWGKPAGALAVSLGQHEEAQSSPPSAKAQQARMSLQPALPDSAKPQKARKSLPPPKPQDFSAVKRRQDFSAFKRPRLGCEPREDSGDKEAVEGGRGDEAGSSRQPPPGASSTAAPSALQSSGKTKDQDASSAAAPPEDQAAPEDQEKRKKWRTEKRTVTVDGVVYGASFYSASEGRAAELTCVECGKRYASPGSLGTHIGTQHLGHRYPCRKGCAEDFGNASTRWLHEKAHRNE